MQAIYDTSGCELITDYGIIEGTPDSHLLYLKDTKYNNYWLLTIYNNKLYCFCFCTDILSTINIDCYMSTTGINKIIVFKDNDKLKTILHILEFTSAYYNYGFIELYNEIVNTSGYILK